MAQTLSLTKMQLLWVIPLYFLSPLPLGGCVGPGTAVLVPLGQTWAPSVLLTSLFSTSLAGILSPECEGQLLLRGCVIWSNDSATGKVINNVQVEYREFVLWKLFWAATRLSLLKRLFEKSAGRVTSFLKILIFWGKVAIPAHMCLGRTAKQCWKVVTMKGRQWEEEGWCEGKVDECR